MRLNPVVANISDAISGLNPYQPGRPIADVARERGIDNIIKLASNENPLGAGSRALAVLQQLDADTLARYPDANGGALRTAISRHLGIEEDSIILGNGSNEVLELVAQLTLHEGSIAVYSAHAFIVYQLATIAHRAAARQVAVTTDFAHDLSAMAAAANEHSVRLMFIANPNNPTGTWHPPQAIRDLLQQVPPQVLVVLDEAYHEYTDIGGETLKLLDDFPNLLITRTFSKIHGIAGLRAGYGIADRAIIEMLNRIRQPFNMNTIAQLAAAAALDDTAHIAASIRANREGMKTLSAALKQLDIPYLSSSANFITFRPPDADNIYEKMLSNGIIIRKLSEYDMSGWLRVTIGSAEENERVTRLLNDNS